MKNLKSPARPPRVINFSGGRTSAYMTITNYRPGDYVIFCDTGREHPKTYKFINDFEAHEGIPVIRLGNANSFNELLTRKHYKKIPNRMKRVCTVELKIRKAKRYLKSIGILKFDNLLGFRADEPQRVLRRQQEFKKVSDKFPLYEAGVTKSVILQYWKNKPYNLEIPSILGNCDLCFMKGKNAIIAILTVYPDLADKWIADEDKASVHGRGYTYFPDVTYRQLKEIAQNNLFKDYDLSELEPAYSCACHA